MSCLWVVISNKVGLYKRYSYSISHASTGYVESCIRLCDYNWTIRLWRLINTDKLTTVKATFHYVIQVADLVCNLVADLLARASSLLAS